ncbi:MAG: hypothetical protein DRI46_10950 [Chloroflexi bacterium]|nr:MAG: hypothetical protein DRI46_10950 [Chloroflexota bacterium]
MGICRKKVFRVQYYNIDIDGDHTNEEELIISDSFGEAEKTFKIWADTQHKEPADPHIYQIEELRAWIETHAFQDQTR